MCTSIIENARAEGMAKRGDEWFPLSQAVVAYDHARHAPLGDVITLDFINTHLDPGAREAAGFKFPALRVRRLRQAGDGHRALALAVELVKARAEQVYGALGVGHGEVLATTTVGLSPTAVKKITDQLDATV